MQEFVKIGCLIMHLIFFLILLSFAIPPFVEGVELIEQRFLENFEEVFSQSQLVMILLFCKFFLLFKLILYPFVCRCRSFTHNNIYMSMNFNMCRKPPLHWHILYNFLLELNLHLVLLFFILMKCFQVNLSPS